MPTTTDNAGSAETLPEALRLADALEGAKHIDDPQEWIATLDAAVAELRRLHALASAPRAHDTRQAFADRYQADPADPAVMVDLAIYRAGWIDALASADRWQDISTAPKQGIWHDGHNHYAEYILAWYPGARSPLRARWWYRDDSDACNFLADGDYAVFPTHWCPLPAAPSKAKGAEG